jgi:hypothetical protein
MELASILVHYCSSTIQLYWRKIASNKVLAERDQPARHAVSYLPWSTNRWRV